ncbi:hypothetical protein BGZ47_000552 [Haplosporangium gracile]|nr:hypothetical protein BGZ47_000552 [Haplosporangium gracile]
MRKVKCHFDKCHHGYLTLDTKPTRLQEHHIQRYHQHVAHTLGLMGAIFCFRRDSSAKNNLDHHVKGLTSQSQSPCPAMCNKAREVVATNARCEDTTIAINYWPGGTISKQSAHTESEVESVYVESMDVIASVQAEFMDEVEGIDAEFIEAFESVEEEYIMEEENANLRNILMENDRVLADAAEAIRKLRSNIKKALERATQ